VAVCTLVVDTEKFIEVEFCGTVTDAGTMTAEFELESVTSAPPLPAAPVRPIVPVPDWPPTIALGDTETPLNAAGGGLTVRPKVSLVPE
jgi:hypothetical protein